VQLRSRRRDADADAAAFQDRHVLRRFGVAKLPKISLLFAGVAVSLI